jgi:hypothetical protein
MLYLRGLESLDISTGRATLHVSVQSGEKHRISLTLDGKHLAKDSPFWMDVRAFDSAAKQIDGLPDPDKGGYFKMAVPKVMLGEKVKVLTIKWAGSTGG